MTFSDFFDRLGNLDWLAVLVGAIVFMVLGALWFGPLFGKQWSAGTGKPRMSGIPQANKLVGTFAYSFVVSAGVNYFGVLDDIEHAVVSAILLGVFMIGAAAYAAVVWMDEKVGVWIINVGFWFVGIAVVNFVQGLLA
ncbi:MAG TPA: DUF1761 domain-containing protein [Acidimicrobiia bacterium]|nr:DUF1761 domain-containing protein [Acidimicrobiia bacterium]